MLLNLYIDHTLLKPIATQQDIIVLCKEAMDYKFKAVCINPCYVALAKKELSNSNIKICTVIGFPLGASSTEVKVFEAKNAIKNGATEIDMVINIGHLKSNDYLYVIEDIAAVKKAIGNTVLKVILEISELTDDEIIKACQICLDANADFIKTSTGFSSSGASLHAVKLMTQTVKNQLKIKASGGIKNRETALEYINAGADRIGTSSGVTIISN